MRVAILCPYSLSVPGGVQGQVLGLARDAGSVSLDLGTLGAHSLADLQSIQ